MSHRVNRYDILMKTLEIVQQELSNKEPRGEPGDYVISIGEFILSIWGGNFDMSKKVTLKRSPVSGDFVVADWIQGSFKSVPTPAVCGELEELLRRLETAVGEMVGEMSKEQSQEAKDDLGKLVGETTSGKPRKKYWSVSVESLKQAAKDVGELGKPVLEILEIIVPLLIKISS